MTCKHTERPDPDGSLSISPESKAAPNGYLRTGRGLPRAGRANGESPAAIARALGVSRASVYRHLASNQ